MRAPLYTLRVLRRLPLLLSFLLLSACASSTTPATSSNPYPVPSSGTTPSAATLTCSTDAPASADWPSAAQLPSDPAITNANVSGNALTVTFIHGTPAYTITTQNNANFPAGPSGRTVTLQGNHGVLIRMTGFRGDVSNDTGPAVFAGGGPLLLQVQKLSDFEGVVMWGAGLSGPGCVHVLSTPGGSSLTFEFVAPPSGY